MDKKLKAVDARTVQKGVSCSACDNSVVILDIDDIDGKRTRVWIF